MAARSAPTASFLYRGVPTKTWREVPLPTMVEVRNLLSKVGDGLERDRCGENELWRARFGSSVFTGYQNGTIYCTGGLEPDLQHIYLRIDEKVRGRKKRDPAPRRSSAAVAP
jgi:hypothetical protein